MNKLYKRFFEIPKNENIPDNIFRNRITISVITVLFCLTIMISTAFAFFNCNLTKNFTMQAANWEIYVEDAKGEHAQPVYTCPSVAGEIHEFTISPIGTAKKGYCIIRIENNEGVKTYYTDSFEDDIKIKIQAVAGCTVKFTPRWGKPSNYGITEIISGTIYHSFTPPPPPDETTGTGDSGESKDESLDNAEIIISDENSVSGGGGEETATASGTDLPSSNGDGGRTSSSTDNTSSGLNESSSSSSESNSSAESSSSGGNESSSSSSDSE